MQLTDSLILCPKGRFKLDIYRRTTPGRWVLDEQIDEPNLVVDLCLDIHIRSLAGNAQDVVNRFGIGTNGIPPVGGNTGLAGLFSKAIDAVDYPGLRQVRFGFSLGSAEANGMAIREFGLLTNGGRLYARKVRGAALNKTADISFTGTWVITL